MPRRARLPLPNLPLHIIQRGNNRQASFFVGEDYQWWSIWVNGNWRITFEFRNGHAFVLDYEDFVTTACTSRTRGTFNDPLDCSPMLERAP